MAATNWLAPTTTRPRLRQFGGATLSAALFSGTVRPVKRQLVQSSGIVSVGYEARSGLLEIEFKGARLYQYEGVPQAIFDWLLRTPGKAAYVQRMIAPNYAYRAVCAPGPTSADDLEEALRRSLRPSSESS